jgi:hypothetical protein
VTWSLDFFTLYGANSSTTDEEQESRGGGDRERSRRVEGREEGRQTFIDLILLIQRRASEKRCYILMEQNKN